MQEEAEFQRWIQQLSRTTEERIELANLANSHFVRDQYGRRITPLPQDCLSGINQEKPIFDSSSDESDAMGLEEHSYIFSWRSEGSDVQPAAENRCSSQRAKGSDRDLLSSQSSRTSLRGVSTERRDSTASWATDRSNDSRTMDPTTQLRPTQSGSLKRKAAVRRKSTRGLQKLSRSDDSGTGEPSQVGEVMRIPTAPAFNQSQSPYPTAGEAGREMLTGAPLRMISAHTQALQNESDGKHPSLITSRSKVILDTPPCTAGPHAEPCAYKHGQSQYDHEQNEFSMSERSGFEQGRPRIARTFSQMGIGRVIPTALADEG